MKTNASDWLEIGKSIGLMLVGAVAAWNAWRAQKRERKLDSITEKVEQVRVATDGNLSEQLHIGMVAARTLANQTHMAEHRILADVAEQKYKLHVEQLTRQRAGETVKESL